MSNSLPPYFTPSLISSIRTKHLEKGECLFRTGDKVIGIYFIIKGEMKAVRHMAAESEAVMVRACSGEFFAESAIATDKYSCDGVCIKKAKLAFISTSNLNKALEDAEFAKAFFLANAANARHQCSRYERVRLRSARERVLHLLACEGDANGELLWPSPLTELAVELALEPETLYRVLAELSQDGSIERDGRKLKLTS